MYFVNFFVFFHFFYFRVFWVAGSYGNTLLYCFRNWCLKNTEVRFRILPVCIVWCDFECFSSEFDFFYFVWLVWFIIDKMVDNQDWLRFNIVYHHASVRKEKARPSRASVDASSFDVDASTFGVQVSPTSSSRRHVSPAATPEAPPI